ncbi:hypothetical protein ACH5RR_023435 [Cinchona calisaya]|uniref:Uncharacterized protein n=1 Tax=Cinchona calisaya TaxID=153742 RepID=A0ABD2ZBT6_9GENT
MERSAPHSNQCAQVPQQKRAEVLNCQREQSARHYAEMTPDKKEALLRRRRSKELYAQKRKRNKNLLARKGLSRLEKIPEKPLVLPSAPNCEHCGAKRLHLEPPNFLCSGGQVLLVIPSTPYDLLRLYSGLSEESLDFQKKIHTYNNSLAFTSLGEKYDHELTKNSKGVYTFCVEGQVYHYLNGLMPSVEEPSGIQLYFYDTEEELSRRLDSLPKLRESTVKLLTNVLG